MARSGRSDPKKQLVEPRPIVENNQIKSRMLTYTTSAVPVRTLMYIEVGDLPPSEVQQAVASVRGLHGSSLHPTFILPIRHGRLTSELIFEQELLDFIKEICVVNNDQIELRDGAHDIDVLRSRL